MRHLAHGGAAADAACGDCARAGRHGGCGGMGRKAAARRRLLRRAGRLDLHPDRHQPRQRLLGRQARRGHRRPARAGPRHIQRPRHPATGSRATWVAFGVAVLCGAYLAAVAGIVILLIGAVSIAAGVLYTGGPRPYGYAGLGEVFVFLFFGLVAVNGSYYVQLERLDALPLGLSIAVGFLATAILVVNNVRDLETDRRAGKMTLAVRMGRGNAVGLYRLLVLGAFVALPVAVLAGGESALPLIGLHRPAARDRPDAGDVEPHRRPGAEHAPWPAPARCSASSACLSPPACCSRAELRRGSVPPHRREVRGCRHRIARRSSPTRCPSASRTSPRAAGSSGARWCCFGCAPTTAWSASAKRFRSRCAAAPRWRRWSRSWRRSARRISMERGRRLAGERRVPRRRRAARR